jgi:putative DNA methylase
VTQRRKLIEVALPLEAINRESAREKSIRHGHPSTLHLWWARRPLATTRAVLFSQLVDDPGSRPEAEAITDDGERAAWVSAERARLFRLMEQLVTWENSTNESVLEQALAEIRRSTGGSPPAILDPFAGGGAIPLEAQRLGLEAHASDLNPVAVLINKALLDVPPRFAGRAPVHPGVAESRLGAWPRATGLAEDVRQYGGWISDTAQRELGYLYPRASLPDGTTAPVIAWIWARTVICPNPACGIRMPLVRSWWLGKKKGKEAYVVPSVSAGKVMFEVGHDPRLAPTQQDGGTVSRTGARCVGCDSAVSLDYIREEGQAGRLESQLMATVAEGQRRRIYLAPTSQQSDVTAERPTDVPAGSIATNPRWFSTPAFGLTEFQDLFTNRQLTLLTTLSDLVTRAREDVLNDAVAAGIPHDERLANGGTGAVAYADAVASLLGFAVSRLASTNSSLCRWNSAPSKESVSDTFSRQAIPMVWDYAEGNPWVKGPCNFDWSCSWVSRALDHLPGGRPASVEQRSAEDLDSAGMLISTDPPYYDNIGYSDLSDFFYVWLRRSLRDIYPELLSTLLVPKAEELVANPYRHGGKDEARAFFEAGFRKVFSRARDGALSDYPITVFYAFKQSESEDEGQASTGWETLLDGMVDAGWQVTGTWPMRSERGGRMISVGTNALASSIVLALRPRPETAPVIDRRRFVSELRDELPDKLRELQQGSIAPVDLPQAAIGPGMAILSRYSKVVEANGEGMTVRSALQVINQILGEVLSAQEGDFDSGTRWCVKWFESYGFDPGPYGEAETLASAFNTSVSGLDRSGALSSRGGKVQLFDPAALAAGYDPRADDHITLWEVVVHLAKALDEQGLDSAGLLMARAAARIDLDAAKELAYLLFSVAERKRWSGVAQLFNMLAASWADVLDAARRTPDAAGEQLVLDAAY